MTAALCSVWPRARVEGGWLDNKSHSSACKKQIGKLLANPIACYKSVSGKEREIILLWKRHLGMIILPLRKVILLDLLSSV